MGEAVRGFKHCYRCKCTDPPEGFSSNGYCRPCASIKSTESRNRNIEKARANHRAHYQRHKKRLQKDAVAYARKMKIAALQAYGATCACCGEGRMEFLAIDHIEGGGRKHRAEIGVSPGYGFYRWLKRNGYPPGFRVLCHNCNMAMGFFGYCPHKEGSKYELSAVTSYDAKKQLATTEIALR